jgi:hypothetical protein
VVFIKKFLSFSSYPKLVNLELIIIEKDISWLFINLSMKCNECKTYDLPKCECCSREICPDCLYLAEQCQCRGIDPELFRRRN